MACWSAVEYMMLSDPVHAWLGAWCIWHPEPSRPIDLSPLLPMHVTFRSGNLGKSGLLVARCLCQYQISA